MAIEILSISPLSGDNDEITVLTIIGNEFVSGATVLIGDESATNVVFVNSTYLTCEVPAGLIPEIYDVTVTNPDLSTDTLEDIFRATIPLPDPPFEGQTLANITSRIIANTNGEWDKRTGTPVRDFINAFAIELAKLYENANILLQYMFPQTSNGDYLDLLGQQHGILRVPAIKATASLTVTGTNGTVIPEGTIFITTVLDISSSPSIEFESTAAATISGGTATVPVIAVLGGTAGNVAATKINNIGEFISGVLTISNASPASGGAEAESDADFLERFLQTVRNPVAGGNKADYETWALEVEGVGGAVCIPLWDGPGTVKVVITDDDGQPADAGLIVDVQEYISPAAGTGEGKAPIGADVTIVAPTTVSIDVVVNITAATGFVEADVIQSVEDNLTDFILAIPIGDDVKYTAIANVIYDTEGVSDYDSLTVEGGTANVVIASGVKAIVGTLTVT